MNSSRKRVGRHKTVCGRGAADERTGIVFTACLVSVCPFPAPTNSEVTNKGRAIDLLVPDNLFRSEKADFFVFASRCPSR